MNSNEIYLAAFIKWGAENQIRMVYEETSELVKALCKYQRGADNLEEIAEEIADVQIMLEQMMLLFRCEYKVRGFKRMKIKRLKERLEERYA